MTRRRELMCDDLFGCEHEPETPVTQDGEIVYWLCRCGRRHYPETAGSEPSQPATQEGTAELGHSLSRQVDRMVGSLTPKERELLKKRFPNIK